MNLPFKKTGEHGFGDHVLVLYSSAKPAVENFFQKQIDKRWKVHYIHVDLNDAKNLRKNFVDSLNYFHYAKNVIVDLPSFWLLLENLEKIAVNHEGFNKIIVFNPAKLRSFKSRFISNLVNFLDIQGNKVKFPDHMTDDMLALGKMHFIKAKKIKVIALDNKNEAFKIASHLKGVVFQSVEKYEEFLEFLKEEFN